MIYELQKNEYSEIAGHTVIYATDLPAKYVRKYRVMELARKIFEDLDPELHFLRRPNNQARVAVEIIPVLDSESGNLSVLIQHKEQTSFSRNTAVCQFVREKVIEQSRSICIGAIGTETERTYWKVRKMYCNLHLSSVY